MTIESTEKVNETVYRQVHAFKRIWAFLLDCCILAVGALISGILIGHLYAKLGLWGRLVGFVIVLLYFGILNSYIGRGKTLGKRLFGQEVVDCHGTYLSLPRSLLRTFILWVPFFLNGMFISCSMVMSVTGALIGFVVFGLGGAIFYLFIFNWQTHQSLHDIVVGSYVIQEKPTGLVKPVRIWFLHYLIVGAWLVLILFLCVCIPIYGRRGVFPELIKIEKKIKETCPARTASLATGQMWQVIDGQRTLITYFDADVMWKFEPEDADQDIDRVAEIIQNSYPKIDEVQNLKVTISYGYDIGLARGWNKTSRIIEENPSVTNKPHT